MKKLIVLTCTLSLLTACGDSIEKKAGEKLAAARAAFERNDYNEAKLQIDSIKILYLLCSHSLGNHAPTAHLLCPAGSENGSDFF